MDEKLICANIKKLRKLNRLTLEKLAHGRRASQQEEHSANEVPGFVVAKHLLLHFLQSQYRLACPLQKIGLGFPGLQPDGRPEGNTA